MDVLSANRDAWNEEVERRNYWTRIVDEETITQAYSGNPKIWVTPSTIVPLEWIKPLKGEKVLNACGGGGQQTPILASFGASVTVLDNAERQLDQDRAALEKYGLEATLVKGDVSNLPFPDDSFSHIVNPCSLNFVEDIFVCYKEFRRVLRKGGTLIMGIANPVLYIFDEKKQEKKLKVKYTLPYSDLTSLSRKEIEKMIRNADTIEFSHTLDTIIGGLISSGFIIDGFFSDFSGSEPTDSFIRDAYLAIKATLISK